MTPDIEFLDFNDTFAEDQNKPQRKIQMPEILKSMDYNANIEKTNNKRRFLLLINAKDADII